MTADSLIRPSTDNSHLEVDVVDYMNGPGRFATASKFQVVDKFLNPWTYAGSASLAPGSYTKNQLYKALGISDIKDKLVSVEQYLNLLTSPATLKRKSKINPMFSTIAVPITLAAACRAQLWTLAGKARPSSRVVVVQSSMIC